LHVDHDFDLADLALRSADGQIFVIHTTQNHLFWDQTGNIWIPAGQLQPGHRLHTPNNALETVVAVLSFAAPRDMYNLTIAIDHTYYVIAGNTPVLVHNVGCWSTRYERAGDLAGKYTEGQSTRDPASQWYHEELSNDELLDGIINATEGDGIVVSRDGTILGGHHRLDELQTRINDGRIDPDTLIRIDVYDGE
jgi:hypothetical protein